MQIQRTVPLVIAPDRDLERTIDVFREVQHALSEPCFNGGKPLGALALQRACYHQVKGSLSAQMTISAIRLVFAAYASARANKKPAQCPFFFKKARALFLVGKRGRDADFHQDGTLSIWTVAGRKHLTYSIPQDFETTFEKAVEIDSLTVTKRHGKLIGRVTFMLDAPEPQGFSR
ncbi:hypothetical protein [Ktedonobacter racemifer]|uniref:hypothetical protein n=1 Tax=Ktedonobacter racemifer TaxID=363277 RepID=UPI00058E49F7|nr:hypothetical protein [Ktedonobacter racemifer]